MRLPCVYRVYLRIQNTISASRQVVARGSGRCANRGWHAPWAIVGGQVQQPVKRAFTSSILSAIPAITQHDFSRKATWSWLEKQFFFAKGRFLLGQGGKTYKDIYLPNGLLSTISRGSKVRLFNNAIAMAMPVSKPKYMVGIKLDKHKIEKPNTTINEVQKMALPMLPWEFTNAVW